MGRRQCGVDSRTRSTLDAKTVKIAPRCCARGCKWTGNILMAFPPSPLSGMTQLHSFWPLCKLWHVSEPAGPLICWVYQRRLPRGRGSAALPQGSPLPSLQRRRSDGRSAVDMALFTGSHNQVLMFVRSAAITYPWTPFSPRPRLYSGESSEAHWPTAGC